jgi:hypothetical protein
MSNKPNTDRSSPTDARDSLHGATDIPCGEAEHPSWLERLFSRIEEAVEDWGLTVQDTSWSRTVRGIVLPIALWAFGIYIAVVQKLGLRGALKRWTWRTPVVLTGWGALAFGLALICFGLCLHFHYYWRLKQSRVGAVGMFMSLVLTGVFLIGFIWALLQM